MKRLAELLTDIVAVVGLGVWLLAALELLACFGVDEQTHAANECDSDSDSDSDSDECAPYPEGPYAWNMNQTVPNSLFTGQPEDLVLEDLWCDKSQVKSLIFVLGFDG